MIRRLLATKRLRLYVIADYRPEPQSWPTPEEAYVNAPSLLRELNSVLQLTLDLQRPGGRTPLAEREQRLRKAALLDRIALREVEQYTPEVAAEAVETAEIAALAFALADGADGCDDPVTGPNAPHWAEVGYRGYVRQEYLRWRSDQ